MNGGRNFGFSKSDRHRALDEEFPPDRPTWLAPSPRSRCTGLCNQGRLCDCVPNIEEEEEPMSLPASRQVIAGRTFSSPWDPASYGNAFEPPPPSRRVADVVFGLAMAAVVCATLWVLLTYRAAP